jgi:hypothetical protein
MMTFAELIAMLRECGNGTVEELRSALEVGRIHPVTPGPGRDTAGILHGTFGIRDKTSTAAGATKSGLETTLQGLQRLDREDIVLLYHFSGPERVFTVFIREADRSLVGCVRVDRSDRSQRPGSAS